MIDYGYHGRVLRGIAGALYFLFAMAAPMAFSATQPGPAQVITDFQQTLIGAMKQGRQLGFKGRYEKLAPVVEKTHDIPAIVRVAVGKYWEQLSSQQRKSLEDTFIQLSIATYASEFNSYSGEHFTTPTVTRSSGPRALVDSALIESSGKKDTFTYQMHATPKGWQIVNIVANGVSDLALKRAQYTSIIQNDGFDALIAKLKQKIAQYEKESSP